MKKTLLVLAIGCLVAGTSGAQSSIRLFGIVDVGVRSVKNGDTGANSSVVSGSNATSRWGMTGTEDLGGGLSAQFWLESGINADTGGTTGTAGQLFDRKSTVGLVSAQAGELRLGRDYRPTHVAWSGIDPFTTTGVGSANQFNGASSVIKGTGADVTRASNTVQYFLPAGLGGLSGSLFVSQDEGGTVAAGAAKSRGGRIGYAASAWNLALSTVKISNTGASGLRDTVVSGAYDFGPFKLGAAQRTFRWGTEKMILRMLALTAPAGLGQVKLSLVQANQKGATAAVNDADARQLALGYVHDLSKRTALYGTATRILNKNGAVFLVPGGLGGMQAGRNSTGYELGLRHAF